MTAVENFRYLQNIITWGVGILTLISIEMKKKD